MAKNNEIVKVETEVAINNGLLGMELMETFRSEGLAFGFGVMDRTDFKLTSFSLLQPTSIQVTRDGLKAGEFYNSTTKTTSPEIILKLGELSKTMAKWRTPFKRGDEADCSSFDSVTGSKYGSCAKCKFKNWGPNNEKPECNKSYVWLCLLDGDPKKPCRIRASGTSYSEARDFNQEISSYRYASFVFTVKLSSRFESNDQGAYFVLKFEIVNNLTREILDSLGIANIKDVTPEFHEKLKEAMKSYEETITSYSTIFKKQINDISDMSGDDDESPLTPETTAGLI